MFGFAVVDGVAKGVGADVAGACPESLASIAAVCPLGARESRPGVLTLVVASVGEIDCLGRVSAVVAGLGGFSMLN